MQRFKLTRVTAIIIGVVISLILIAGGLITYFGVFSRASSETATDVIISKITSQSATITWTTGQETQGTIEYGTSPAELGFYAPEAVKGTTHKVDLTLLQPNTTHYFIIRIGESVYDNAGIPWSFSTKPVEAEAIATPEASLDEATPEAFPSITVTRVPTLTKKVNTPTVTPRKTAVPTVRSSTATSTPIPTRISCTSTNCEAIAGYLGPGKCSVQDYYLCIRKRITPTVTPLYSVTPSPTPSPAIDRPTVDTPVVAPGSITISFTDRSTNESGYLVERATQGPTLTWAAVSGCGAMGPYAGSGTKQSCVDTSVSAGTAYRYRVSAFISGTVPSYSNPPSPSESGTDPVTAQ